MGVDIVAKSTGKIKTSVALAARMLLGLDIIGGIPAGSEAARVIIYDGGSNSSTNVLFEGVANIAETETFELSYPVVGVGKLWAEISGVNANVVVRCK